MSLYTQQQLRCSIRGAAGEEDPSQVIPGAYFATGQPSIKVRRGYDDFSQQMPLPSLAQEVPLSAYSGAEGAYGPSGLSSLGSAFPCGHSGSVRVMQQSGSLARGESGGDALLREPPPVLHSRSGLRPLSGHPPALGSGLLSGQPPDAGSGLVASSAARNSGLEASAATATAALGQLSVGSASASHSSRGALSGAGTESARSELGMLGPEDDSPCRRFTYDQLKAATDNFSQANFLGRGPYDAVFKGKLMGCKVAVKRLEGGGWQGQGQGQGQGQREYRTEVDVLSRMRHPNIVLLMGHCPEEHCLVYEFLAGGNLQRSLEGASRPLKWFDRIRVLAQIVDALLFLHHHDPPIVHRDLSPENILLANGTVKLADVGLARLLREDDTVTAGPKGTPGYIDPAEVMSCEVSVLGDVYALGLVGLQLLLGEASIQRLQKRLQETSSGGQERVLHAVLDKLDNSAGDWPMALTRDLALLLVRCADHRRARRPDLAEEVQPLLRQAAERADAQSQREADGLELQLICPLAKVRMTDPVLAADGFTYDRAAIQKWLMRSQDSPVTGHRLEHTFLTPNNSLRHLLLLS